MKIADIYETWIHTHFITDSHDIIPEERFRIDMRVTPELRRVGIQYGFHYEQKSDSCAIVLECIPLPKIKDYVKDLISDTIKDMPSRKKDELKNVVTKITVENDNQNI